MLPDEDEPEGSPEQPPPTRGGEAKGGAVPDVARAAAVLDRIEADLAGVSAALGRMEDGSYRTCEVCAGEIGDERLLADPVGRRCEACAPRPDLAADPPPEPPSGPPAAS